jgi:hypothetical protein
MHGVTNVNARLRQPILLCDMHSKRDVSKEHGAFIPNLSEYGIPSIIDSHRIYQQIVAFLGWLKDNPVPPDNQTDKDKVVSHGFDLKNSFRPNMKC